MSKRNSNPDIIDMPQPPAVYEHKTGVKIAGILMAIVGFACGGASFLWSLILLLGAAFVDELGFGLGLGLRLGHLLGHSRLPARLGALHRLDGAWLRWAPLH